MCPKKKISQNIPKTSPTFCNQGKKGKINHITSLKYIEKRKEKSSPNKQHPVTTPAHPL
jgi:hypothetical protein